MSWYEAITDGLWDSMEEYGTPMVFTVLECEGIDGSELLRPVE